MKKLLFLLGITYLFAGFPEYYYKLPISKQKKEFEKILLPMVEKENKKILLLRQKVIKIFNDPDFIFDNNKIIFLSKVARNYKIKDIYNKEEFLKKIDMIPPKLVLAQGAIESGWGRSYFVKKANNIFGQWDYTSNGLMPRNRDANATHTVRIFRSLDDSLRVYMRNLNRNRAYRKFRELRYEYKKQHKIFSAEVAATTLKEYSELGEEYVKRLQKMIKQF